MQKDMQLSLPRDRFFGDRQTLLGKLAKLRRDADVNDQVGVLDDLQQQAYDILLGGGVALSVAALGFAKAAPSDAICRSSVFESGFISLFGLHGHRVGLGNN